MVPADMVRSGLAGSSADPSFPRFAPRPLRKESLMLSKESLHEFRSAWLPNITDEGLQHLADLLGKASPLLIHGSFTRAVPQGCLATHIAWNHPRTTHLTQEAGISWLHHVAGLNPA